MFDSKVLSYVLAGARPFMPPKHALENGTSLLNKTYLVGDVVGVNDTALIYEATDLKHDTPVTIREFYPAHAIKFEQKTLSVSPERSGMALELVVCSEACQRAFGRLKKHLASAMRTHSHQNLHHAFNNALEVFEENNTLYGVYPRRQWPTLQMLMETGYVLNDQEIAWLITETLNRLSFIHRSGILHGDLSPSSIIILPDRVILDDQAMSSRVGQITASENPPTRTNYMAPEMAKNHSLGPWSDLYAVGILLKTLKRIYKITTQEGVFNPDFIEKLTAIDVMLRPQSVDDAYHDLAQCMSKPQEHANQSFLGLSLASLATVLVAVVMIWMVAPSQELTLDEGLVPLGNFDNSLISQVDESVVDSEGEITMVQAPQEVVQGQPLILKWQAKPSVDYYRVQAWSVDEAMPLGTDIMIFDTIKVYDTSTWKFGVYTFTIRGYKDQYVTLPHVVVVRVTKN